MLSTQPTQDLVARYLIGELDAVDTVDDWIEGAGIAFQRRLKDRWPDLRQEIRLEVFELLQRGSFRERASLKTYVWRVATHTCLDAVRRLDRIKEVDPGPVLERLHSTERPVDKSLIDREETLEESRQMTRVMAQIDGNCLAMWRKILRGSSYQEMSGHFGVSEGTLRVRVLRCREKARQLRKTVASRTQKEIRREEPPR